MDIGDIVMYGGRRLSVRGFDPARVQPRLIYLEDAETGETISIPFVEPSKTMPGTAGLRLVDEEESS